MTYKVRPRRLYSVLADFDGLEALAEQYGAEVARLQAGGPNGVGRAWKMGVQFKGVHRDVAAQIEEATPYTGYLITGESDGIHVDIRLVVEPNQGQGARAIFTAEFFGKTLPGRLLLQPLRLARGTLEEKFHNRMVAYTRSRLQDVRQEPKGRA